MRASCWSAATLVLQALEILSERHLSMKANLLPTMMSMRGRREGIKAFVCPPTLGGGMAACSGTLVYPPVSMVVNIAFGFCSQSALPTTCRDKTLTVPESGHLGFTLDFVPRSYIPKVSINIISIRLSGGEFNEYMETNV